MNTKNKFASSSEQQRTRLLDALREVGSDGINTIEAREQLDIMMPAARIFELRHKLGHNIQSITTKDTNAQGNSHNCKRYVLLSGTWQAGLSA